MSFQTITAHPDGSLPPEIAFLAARGGDARSLAQAAAQARQAGTDAASALLRAGLMDEDDYYRALAQEIGAPFLDGPIPLRIPPAYPGCLMAGAAALAPGTGAGLVVAPQGAAIAALLQGRGRAGLPAITTPNHLRRAVYAAIPDTVAAHAAEDLRRRDPRGAMPEWPLSRLLFVLVVALAACLGLAAALPAPCAAMLAVLVQGACLATMVFRSASIFIPLVAEDAPPLPDDALPVYTVLVALYREAAVLARIVPALGKLDYPAAKLDIKFLIEDDDRETAAALARITFPARFEIVTVPPGRPRTKPRALNAALPLARGSLLVVYDAEDVPERDQLRKAAALFARAPASTACLQGHLVIDNQESRLTRLFALDYASLFDVLNPALAALDMPIPLGGTSTHLRTRVLRDLCGWDPWNVTEDADLGLRLALAGYRVGDLPSATFEEAPLTIRAWLHQRTRWMKGFLQTSLVHGRNPLAALARLGPLRALCAVALVPGTVASALAYLPCALMIGWTLTTGGFGTSMSLLSNLGTGLALTLFLTGLFGILAPPVLGCHRRRWPDLIPYAWMLPGYYLLVSLAAWLAVIELVRAPERWNKTEHGLSRTSRSGRLTRVC